MALPNGLFRGHRLIVEAVDKGPFAVDFIAPLVQLAEIRTLQMADSGVQAVAYAKITFQVFALGIDQKNHPFVLKILDSFMGLSQSWNRTGFQQTRFTPFCRKSGTNW